jgi:hypothetical protein
MPAATAIDTTAAQACITALDATAQANVDSTKEAQHLIDLQNLVTMCQAADLQNPNRDKRVQHSPGVQNIHTTFLQA